MKPLVSEKAGSYLLQLARSTVEALVSGRAPNPPPTPAGIEDELSQNCGMFVTLKTKGQLRGCIGTFTSNKPLPEQLRITAEDSTLNDSRFFGNRLRPEEINDLEVEISLLGPITPTDRPEDIEIGIHGIVVSGLGRYAGRRGVFLPQVATEFNLDTETFWNWVCSHKAGMPEDAWRNPEICLCEIFQAQVIEENRTAGR